MPDINDIHLFRIIHKDNLPYILETEALYCPRHPNGDPDYIPIGDKGLIDKRNAKLIPIDPGGDFSDYIAFYFGTRSPMLYNIKNGYGVPQVPQKDIIYLVAKYVTVKASQRRFVFTDGHGKNSFTRFSNHEPDLMDIDWRAVNARVWGYNQKDPDLRRRKQSEFLVHRELPISALVGIAVYDEETKREIESLLQTCHIALPVKVKTEEYYY